MLKAVNKDELCQISLTGARALTLLGLLAEKPYSLDEIKEKFVDYNIMSDSNSNDIIRIDINTLKKMGCEISRAGMTTNYKFKLMKNPFNLNMSIEEVAIIKRAYNKIKNSLNTEELIQYYELFNKIAEQLLDNDAKKDLLNISVINDSNVEKIKKFTEDCKYVKTLTILYKAPLEKEKTKKNIIALRFIYQNEKFYLYGYDIDLKKSITLNYSRIKEVLSETINDQNMISESVSVTFKLINFGIQGLNENENIIKGDFKNGYIIEGKYHNKFIALQRILSFGSDCEVIEPSDFKEKIIESLKKIREVYNG